jgi:hypothetical protein
VDLAVLFVAGFADVFGVALAAVVFDAARAEDLAAVVVVGSSTVGASAVLVAMSSPSSPLVRHAQRCCSRGFGSLADTMRTHVKSGICSHFRRRPLAERAWNAVRR